MVEDIVYHAVSYENSLRKVLFILLLEVVVLFLRDVLLLLLLF